MDGRDSRGSGKISLERVMQVALLLAAAALLSLHFLHLRADFPNHSPWTDWAKYTDEGWYGDAAIRHYLRGTWRLAGDFNPGVALPVWPLVEGVVFRFTGVGIVAARALTVVVFAAIMITSYCLLQVRAETRGDGPMRRVFAAAALVLLAVSPFVYVFTRMAILEPLLVLLVELALLTAYLTRFVHGAARWAACSAVVGVLVALMIVTKTTAIFLLPAIVYMLWDSAEWKPRRMVRFTAVAAATTGLIVASYFAVLVHHGYLQDFRYLFSANSYTGITRATFFKVVGEAFKDGMWIGPIVYPLALLVLLVAVFRPRVWKDAVFTSLALWALGYAAFLAYHANMQPRYYLVVAIPLMLLLVRGALHIAEWNRMALYAMAPLLLVVVARDLHQMVGYATHPQYSFQTAARQVESVVESEPQHSHTVLSISGSDLSLMTGLPSICDDFGTMELEDRIAAYKPGWFVAWNYVEDDKMAALAKFYTLTRVAEFPAMDDPDRNVMIVYRLDAKVGEKPKRDRPGARMLPTALTQIPEFAAGPKSVTRDSGTID